jgi:hypothetical protein
MGANISGAKPEAPIAIPFAIPNLSGNHKGIIDTIVLYPKPAPIPTIKLKKKYSCTILEAKPVRNHPNDQNITENNITFLWPIFFCNGPDNKLKHNVINIINEYANDILLIGQFIFSISGRLKILQI